jgi:hypothetical protein
MLHFNRRKYALHRLVMEEVLGHPLKPTYEVHHIDGNRGNNHPDNLKVLSPAQHRRLERARFPWLLYCYQCGRPFQRKHQERGLAHNFCSVKCRCITLAQLNRSRFGHGLAPQPAPRIPLSTYL